MGVIVGIISDGLNRSLNALEAGAIDRRKMMSEYRGVGSRHYDLVTEQIVLTATWALPSIRKLFDQEARDPEKQ